MKNEIHSVIKEEQEYLFDEDVEEIILDEIPEELPIAQEYKKRQQVALGQSARSTSQSSKTEQLRELKSLLDEGILTQDEFDAEKAKILNCEL